METDDSAPPPAAVAGVRRARPAFTDDDDEGGETKEAEVTRARPADGAPPSLLEQMLAYIAPFREAASRCLGNIEPRALHDLHTKAAAFVRLRGLDAVLDAGWEVTREQVLATVTAARVEAARIGGALDAILTADATPTRYTLREGTERAAASLTDSILLARAAIAFVAWPEDGFIASAGHEELAHAIAAAARLTDHAEGSIWTAHSLRHAVLVGEEHLAA